MDPESERIKKIIEQIPEEDLKDLLALNETVSFKRQLERIVKQIPDEDLKDLLALHGAGSYGRQFKVKVKNDLSSLKGIVGWVAAIFVGAWFVGGALIIMSGVTSGIVITLVLIVVIMLVLLACLAK